MIDVSLIVIKTVQPEKLADFYSKLGFTFEYHRHGNGPYHYASVGSNVVFEIYPLPKGVVVPDDTTRLGFRVPSLDALIEALRSVGATVVVQPAYTKWGYSAVVQDYDGRKIELTEKSPGHEII